MIKFYNTPLKKVAEFVPQTTGQVKLYTCGPTVYDNLHIGNWVAYIRWDTLVRVLQNADFEVNRVMNITDVGHLVSDADEGEDKIEKGARREGKTAWELAQMYTDDFLSGMSALKLLPASQLAKATDFIPEQIELIKTLEAKGHIYKINDGVYFDTSTFPNYAKFAELDLEAQKAGARIELNAEKHNPSDFALWKFTPAGTTRDMEWDSPWGPGFPGWHLECSAIAMKFLGETLDIHTGGIDHIPVHHTNEIAQSESATGQTFSKFWLHNNHMLVDGVKISKSLQNGFTLKDLAEKNFSPFDFKMLTHQSHYRTQANFTWEGLEAAGQRLSHWRHIAELRWQIHPTTESDHEKFSDLSKQAYETINQATAALENDLNTPEALKIIEEYFSVLDNAPIDSIQKSALHDLLEFIDNLFGLDLINSTPDVSDELKQLILERQRVRENGDFKRSDEIRNELEKHEITVKDTSRGPIWQRST